MFLGIDLGTSSVKVVLMDNDKTTKIKGFYPGVESTGEQPAHAVALGVQNTIQSILVQVPGSAQKIATIGLTGHAPSLIFVDKKGQPATPIVTWQDHRAAQEAVEISQKDPSFTKDGTSYEAKLLWYYKRQPQLFEGKYKALYPKDYLAFLLTGEFFIDNSTATCTTFYNRITKKWDNTFVPEEALPPVRNAWEVAGKTQTAFSKACGFLPHTQVVLGGIDCFCEALGGGGLDDTALVDGTGTSTCITRTVMADGKESEHVFPQLGLQAALLSTTGAAVMWYLKNIMHKEFEASDMTMLKDKPPSKILFLPYLNGERSPVWDGKPTGVFLGMKPDTNADQMFLSVLQGVGFAIRQNIEILKTEREDSHKIQKIYGVGGGNRSDVWLQMKADICQIPYVKPKEQDASAYGAALLGGYGGGYLNKEEMQRKIQPEKTFYPSQTHKALYDGLYENYLKLYPSLKEVFHSMCLL